MNQDLRVIFCGLGGWRFALNMSKVVSVQRVSAMKPNDRVATPNATIERHQLGLIPTDGDPIVVINMAARLGRENTRRPKQIVIVRTTKGLIGLAVDSVSHDRKFSLDSFHQVPTLLRNNADPIITGLIDLKKCDVDAVSEDSKQSFVPFLSLDAAPLSDVQSDPPSLSRPSIPPTGRASATVKQLLLMNVAEQSETKYLLALSMTQVVEVMHDVNLESVPLTANDVEGLIRWRDQPVPLVNIAKRCGIGDSTHRDRIVLAQCSNQQRVAFRVDMNIRSLKLPADTERISIPSKLTTQSILGAFQLGSETLLIPNLTNISTSA